MDGVATKCVASKAYYFLSFNLRSQNFACGFFKQMTRKVMGYNLD